jgi:hypothetical protein
VTASVVFAGHCPSLFFILSTRVRDDRLDRMLYGKKEEYNGRTRWFALDPVVQLMGLTLHEW